MKNKQIYISRFLLLGSASFLIIILIILGTNNNVDNFHGIKLLEYSDLLNTGMQAGIVDNFELLYNGKKAPYIEEKKIYLIPQELTQENWEGLISASSPDYEIYFQIDDFLENKSLSIEENHIFEIYIIHNNIVEKRGVIFSGLPIMVIEDDAKIRGNNNTCGNMILFEAENITESLLEYHVKGNTTTLFEKKSYRINTKTRTGSKNKLNLLNLAETDDWVINALYTDDEKIREKLVADLWNQKCAEKNENWILPELKYIEVIINGEYRGIYGLSTIVNFDLEKKQGLGDYIIKIKKYTFIDHSNWVGINSQWETVGPFYMMINPQNNENPWISIRELSERLFQDDTKDQYNFSQCEELINISNQIDSYLFVNGLNLTDNWGTNGVIYQYDSKDKTFIRLMHDFDAALTSWLVGPNNTVDRFSTEKKNEYIDDILMTIEIKQLLSKNPELWSDICCRWTELRESVFSTDNITDMINNYRCNLQKSGVLLREKEKWLDECIVEDEEWLLQFINERMNFLDNYYSKETMGY